MRKAVAIDSMSEGSDSNSSSIKFKKTLTHTQVTPVFLGTILLLLTAAILYTSEPFKTLSAFFATFILAALFSLTGKESYIARRGGLRKYLIWPWTITMVAALSYRSLAMFFIPTEIYIKEFLSALLIGIVALGLLKTYKQQR